MTHLIVAHLIVAHIVAHRHYQGGTQALPAYIRAATCTAKVSHRSWAIAGSASSACMLQSDSTSRLHTMTRLWPPGLRLLWLTESYCSSPLLSTKQHSVAYRSAQPGHIGRAPAAATKSCCMPHAAAQCCSGRQHQALHFLLLPATTDKPTCCEPHQTGLSSHQIPCPHIRHTVPTPQNLRLGYNRQPYPSTPAPPSTPMPPTLTPAGPTQGTPPALPRHTTPHHPSH